MADQHHGAEALETLQRVRPQIAAVDHPSYDTALAEAQGAFDCCSRASALANQWETVFGPKDPCVRGLRDILPGRVS